MPYALRNTLILIILFVVINALGIYVFSFRLRNDTISIESELLTKMNELESIRENNQYFDEIEQSMIHERETWKNLPKRLYRTENSVESFAYFHTLASQKDSRVSFNYRKNEHKTVKSGDISSNRYTLLGDTRFQDLFRFIWKLENYAPLYVIEELEILPPVDRAARDKFGRNAVHFLMTVKGYSADLQNEELRIQSSVDDGSPVNMNSNPFAALVTKQLPPNTGNLLTVDNAVLLGMSSEEAYIKDPSGKVWTIGLGGEVYLGKMTIIDPNAGYVEFTLNEGGFLRKVVLKMSFRSN